MNTPDKRIVRFIKKHHVLSLSTASNNEPYAASLFYLFSEKDMMLVFASDPQTKHIQDALVQNKVAGTITLETFFLKSIRGIQFTGILTELNNDTTHNRYIKRFPAALFIPFKLWGIELQHIKMTDNRLGFGKKIFWNKF